MPYQRVQRWTGHLWHLQLCGKLSVVSLVVMVTMWCNLWPGVTAALQVRLFVNVSMLYHPTLFPSFHKIYFQDSSAFPVLNIIIKSKKLFFSYYSHSIFKGVKFLVCFGFVLAAHTVPIRFDPYVFMLCCCLLRSPVNSTGAARTEPCPGDSTEARSCSNTCLPGIAAHTLISNISYTLQ